MNSINRLRGLLKDRNLKVTPIRLEVLRAFVDSHEPAGVPEIFESVKHTGVNQVSVYRTVQSFVQAGIIREVDLRHGHADYELSDRGDHHHIVCLRCGRVEEFEGCAAKRLIREAVRASAQFDTVTQHTFELFGTCKACETKSVRP